MEWSGTISKISSKISSFFSLPPPLTHPACLKIKSYTRMMMKMKMRAYLLHRKHPENHKKTLLAMFNLQTELVVPPNILYQPSSKPLASVSMIP
jgi:hypothetical protein